MKNAELRESPVSLEPMTGFNFGSLFPGTKDLGRLYIANTGDEEIPDVRLTILSSLRTFEAQTNAQGKEVLEGKYVEARKLVKSGDLWIAIGDWKKIGGIPNDLNNYLSLELAYSSGITEFSAVDLRIVIPSSTQTNQVSFCPAIFWEL